MARVKSYFLNIWKALGGVFVSFSCLLNSILGGRHGQTFSARTGEAKKAGKLWGRIMSVVLARALFDKDHAEEAAREKK